ncbi:MAG: hypothetical protein HKO57_12190, partial [Akkermansiaceae bacterium]|nr:hypothetical protein [Akkermansiaceae bacterium]
MKHAHYILGLTAFCVAGTVAAFIISQPPASPPGRAASGARAATAVPGQEAPGDSSPSSKSERVRMAVLLGA